MKSPVMLIAVALAAVSFTSCRSSSSSSMAPAVDFYGTNYVTNEIYVSPDGVDSPTRGGKTAPLRSIQYALLRNLTLPPPYNPPVGYVVYMAQGTLRPGSGLNLEDSGVRLPQTWVNALYAAGGTNLSIRFSGGWNPDFSAQSGRTTWDGENLLTHLFRVDPAVMMLYAAIAFDRVSFTRGGTNGSVVNPVVAFTNYSGDTTAAPANPWVYFTNCIMSNNTGLSRSNILLRFTNSGPGNLLY